MNTDTYQNALESTKDSIEDVNSAIGFSLGNLTLEKLITSAITLVICVLVIWLVMRVARRISAHSRLSESLSRFILKVLKIALEFMAILIVADSLGFNVTALLAVFSLLGLALSLSVQNCLSNAMSGITILLTRPFEDGDFRASLPRFAPDNAAGNAALVEVVRTLAQARGATPAQIALAWLLDQGPDIVPIPGTKRLKYLEENIQATQITLTDAERSTLRAALARLPVLGARYTEEGMKGVNA